MYLKTDGDVVENSENTSMEVDLLIRLAGLERNDYILDLCCGQGRHCLELARRGFSHLTGLDRSRYLIRLARKRALQGNLQVTFREGDARKFRLPMNSFNCVAMMGNSFGYFDNEDDDEMILRRVSHVLNSRGTLLMDLADGAWLRNNFERRSWEWIDQNQFVCRERSISNDDSRLVCREVIVHTEKGAIVDQFYAERLYNRNQIHDLLSKVGFEAIRFHENLETESERNQDLGMMATRLIVVASAPKKKVISSSKVRASIDKITVIQGDPSLPDSVKRDGRFNIEDMETINKLKSALDEINEYEFHFIDNHVSLITEFRNNPPEFVLNLCDEGLRNEALMELHVPSLLEIHDIPYSGAGPTCLGLCYNKFHVRSIAAALDIPVPLESFFNTTDQSASIPSIFPALIKPNKGDSSIGITKDAVVRTTKELMSYLRHLRETLPGREILIQEFLTGREFSVGIIGNPGLTSRTLPILEVDYGKLDSFLPKILGYESKWIPDSPYWTQIQYHEAKIDDETTRKLFDYSGLLFERLECRDYARFDFRSDSEGEIKLLEVNPNPGWCWDGKLNYMASFAGLRYADMLRLIIEAAQERVLAEYV